VNYSMLTSPAVLISVMLLLYYPSFPLVPPPFITSSSKVLPNTSAAPAYGAGIRFRSPAPCPSLPPDSVFPLTSYPSSLPLFPQAPLSTLVGFVDAAHANDLRQRRSTTGFAFLLAGGGAVAYKSKLNPLRPQVLPKLNSLLRSPPPKLLCTFAPSFPSWIFISLVPPSCTATMMRP
jgi:hypothetical protein